MKTAPEEKTTQELESEILALKTQVELSQMSKTFEDDGAFRLELIVLLQRIAAALEKE